MAINIYEKIEVWLADLVPQHGTEAGKIRPVLIIQNSHLIRLGHPSTLICPLTTKLQKGFYITRIRVVKSEAGIENDSDILIDQIRAIDNGRFKNKIGQLSEGLIQKVKFGLTQILELDD